MAGTSVPKEETRLEGGEHTGDITDRRPRGVELSNGMTTEAQPLPLSNSLRLVKSVASALIAAVLVASMRPAHCTTDSPVTRVPKAPVNHEDR